MIPNSKHKYTGFYDGSATDYVDYGESAKVLFWLLLYIPGVAAGMTGLFSLVSDTIRVNHDVMVITAVFGSITLAVVVVLSIVVCHEMVDEDNGCCGTFFATGFSACGAALGLLGVLGAFYSDWILAAIAENMAGTPSSDNAALYWTYFIAKRMPFFSS
jgi:hypothetical protein